MAEKFDVVVIGSGPAGYVCAIRCAQLGFKTAIVERSELGGICLNWGCIPTKALLRSSEIFHLMQRMEEFGLSASGLKFDLSKIVARSRAVAQRLSSGVSFLMKKHKIEVISGVARVASAGNVHVTKGAETRALTAENIVIATGARARTMKGLEPDGKLVWTYREAMVPSSLPRHLLVVGSGAIGIEFASFFRALGSEVTVVEVQDRILPVEDVEISALAEKSFKKQGMTIATGTTIESLAKNEDEVTVSLKAKDGKTRNLTVDRVILAIGIVGNVEDIGLETLGVKIERSHIVTDRWGATGIPGIWAIGDIVGPPWLAHKGMHEGVIVAERIAGISSTHPLDTSKVPGCTYCYPQIASVGMTEVDAKNSGYDVKVGRFPFVGNGKAIALGEPDGLIKTIFDAQTGELLGAHMIGAEVTELIQGYAVARTLEATDADLKTVIFPHPTLSEMLHEAVLDADKEALHI
jgi:dihydrolipoamide dehydrogenase